MHFGSTLRLLRIDAGLGLRELARRIGVSSAYLSRVEHGRDPAPTPDRLEAIAKAIGIPVSAFLELVGQTGSETTRYLERVPAANSLVLDLARRNLGPLDLARVRSFVEREFPFEKTNKTSLLSMLSPERIVLDLRCSDWDDVLAMLVARLPVRGTATTREVLRRVREREEVHSNYLGEGFALPHALVPELEPMATFALLASPLSADTPDGKPLRCAALVVSPTPDPARLTGFVRLANGDVIDELARAHSAEHVLELLHDRDGLD